MKNSFDSFSWKRSAGMYHMYGRSIKRQLLLYGCLILAIYLLVVAIASYNADYIASYSAFIFIMGFMIYVSPVVFSGRDDSLMSQIPVSPKEKMVFYFGYSLIVVPVFIQGLWWLLCNAGGLVFSVGNVDKIVADTKVYYNMSFDNGVFVLMYVLNIIQTAFLIIISLLVVFTTHKHRLLTCLLSSVGALVGFGIISMIAGIIAGLNGAFDKIMEGGDASPEIIGRDIMSGILPVAVVTSIATVIVMVILVRKIYKRFLHPVIAR